MNTWDPVFLEEMRRLFAAEAEEHVQTITLGLIEIEKEQDPAKRQAATEAVYRAMHSLKGAARSVNMPGIGAICQSAESVLSAMKDGTLLPVETDFDELQRAADCVTRMLASDTAVEEAEVSRLAESLSQIAAKATPSPVGEVPTVDVAEMPMPPVSVASSSTSIASAVSVATDTIRIATAKIDAILLQAEELISIKLAAEQRIAELTDTMDMMKPAIEQMEKAQTRVSVAGHPPTARRRESDSVACEAKPSPETDLLASSLECARQLQTRLGGLLSSLQSDRRAAGALVDQLLEHAKKVLMLPFATLLRTYPRAVRDLSREQNKDVTLLVTGDDIEIDKRILERLKDPLLHLLRNSIDHGLETPDARRARNKPPGGTITIDVAQAEGNRVHIIISDDGAGIDPARLREVAVARGTLSREEADEMDDHEALMLIFQSGVSTSPLITDLSGRGLGMAIVQEAIDALGGRIWLDSKLGDGTIFHISLPLTLATLRGTLVEEQGQLFAVPTVNVDRAIRVNRDDVRTVENRETISVNGTPLSLVRLGAVLGLDRPSNEADNRNVLCVVVLTTGQQRIAFTVDGLLNEQEILTKGLGKQLARVRNISGATVLGSGKVVPVLNVTDLFKSAVLVGSAGAIARTAEKEVKRKSILVAEDSITSRMLLKNILASAGFDVQAVVDGAEAWAMLKERPFDAVVSDIEMPRMTGFDLTARIREDSELAEMPVVLVTSLESRADRERGIEVGANAYIFKSSFDQSNLLEVVRQLT